LGHFHPCCHRLEQQVGRTRKEEIGLEIRA
jgi:hypothetical protein